MNSNFQAFSSYIQLFSRHFQAIFQAFSSYFPGILQEFFRSDSDLPFISPSPLRHGWLLGHCPVAKSPVSRARCEFLWKSQGFFSGEKDVKTHILNSECG
jgi:hypothetical protein